MSDLTNPFPGDYYAQTRPAPGDRVQCYHCGRMIRVCDRCTEDGQPYLGGFYCMVCCEKDQLAAVKAAVKAAANEED
jgi:hypothetical protein